MTFGIFEGMKKKPDIKYPTQWKYRVIGMNEGDIRKAVVAVVGSSPHSLDFSNASAESKYLSFVLEVEVSSDSHREQLHRDLGAHPAIRIVI